MRKTKAQLALSSLEDVCRAVTLQRGNEYISNERYAITTAFPDPEWQNRIFLRPQPSGETVTEALRLMDELTPHYLTYSESEAPADLAERLTAAGLHNFLNLTGMLYPLEGQEALPPQPDVIGIGGDRIDEWASACAAAFHGGGTDRSVPFLLKDTNCRFYAIEKDGRIVSTAMLCMDPAGKHGGIHNVGTLPEARGCGCATKLVRHILSEARRCGMEMISLQASDLGRPVYARIGFEAVSVIRMFERSE